MAALPAHWVNGERCDSIAVTDRGLAYGDGLFETLRFFRGGWLLLDTHLQRMAEGAKRLGIAFAPALAEASLVQARQFLVEAGCEEAQVKLLLTRGSNTSRGAPAGYGGVTPNATFILSLLEVASELLAAPPIARLGLCETRYAAQPQLAGIKHCNRLEQVLAAREIQARNLDNGLMLDQCGLVVSAINGNIFTVKAGRLQTPALGDSGVEGTVRKLLLEVIAPRFKVMIDIADMKPESITEADEVFITNAIVGLQPAQFESREIPHRPLTDRLREAYLSYVLEQLPETGE